MLLTLLVLLAKVSKPQRTDPWAVYECGGLDAHLFSLFENAEALALCEGLPVSPTPNTRPYKEMAGLLKSLLLSETKLKKRKLPHSASVPRWPHPHYSQ